MDIYVYAEGILSVILREKRKREKGRVVFFWLNTAKGNNVYKVCVVFFLIICFFFDGCSLYQYTERAWSEWESITLLPLLLL